MFVCLCQWNNWESRFLPSCAIFSISFQFLISAFWERKKLLTDKFSGTTVNIERIITKLAVGIRGLEQKTVGTKLGLGNVVDTLVVLVALLGVGEEPVYLRTSELSWNRLNVRNFKESKCLMFQNEYIISIGVKERDYVTRRKLFLAKFYSNINE